MKKRLIFVLVLLCLFLSSCVKDDPPKIDDPEDEIIETNFTLTDFFSMEKPVTIEIFISDDELEKINQDYYRFSEFDSKSPIYRMCDLVITYGEEEVYIKEVGIRMKGNTSRRDFYTKKDGIYNLVHFKISFKETFDDEDEYDQPKVWTDSTLRDQRKDRKFLGMETLDLKWNKNYDATHVRQIYAYDKFRENGLLAPHVTLAQVKMKGLSLGLYEVLETIDKNFIERYLPEKDWGGDLYKVGWNNYKGGDLTPLQNPNEVGVEDEMNAYFPNYDLKTNKKKSNHQDMLNLLDRLNNTPIKDLDTVVGEILDMNYWTMFEAVSYLVGNPDDIRNHYNNYYLYFMGSTHKAIIIPYDYDRVMGVTKDWNPTGDAMTKIEPNLLANTMQNGTQQINPLYKHVLLNPNSVWNREYLGRLQEIIESKQFTLEDFLPYYKKAKTLYQDKVVPEIDKIKTSYIGFSLTESSSINRTDVNLSIELYFALKRETVTKSFNK